MGTFDKAVEEVLKREGGYVFDSVDRGGETNWGITKAVAALNYYTGSMKDMPKEVAINIYKKMYWDVSNLQSVAQRSENIALEIFDSGVNCGVNRAGKWFQQALNVLNRDNTLYLDLIVDGQVGQKTIDVFNKLPEKDLPILLKLLNIQQGAHYIEICKANTKQEKFIRGWLTRVIC